MYKFKWRKYMKNNDDDFKTIKIKKDIWLKLNLLKLNEDAKTISFIIKKLIDNYEKNN